MSEFATTLSGKANGNINMASFVAADTSNSFYFLQGVTGTAPLGIVPNTDRVAAGFPGDQGLYAIAGDEITVYGPGSIVQLQLGATVTPYQYLTGNSFGYGVPQTVTGGFVGALALQSGNTGDLIRVLVLPPGSQYP